MGKAAVEAKRYLSDPERFADLFNHEIYSEEVVVDPNCLRPTDTVDASVGREEKRDLVREWARKEGDGTIYALLGIEEQTNAHPAMPVRCALYDALSYEGQIRELTKKNRRDGMGVATSVEFLSGLRRDDCLRPVVTLVRYLGADDWTLPETLHGVLGNDVDEHLMALVPDYRMNLVAPARMSDAELDSFTTDLGRALKFVKHSLDGNDLDRMVHEDKKYETMARETATFLNAVTDSRLRIEPEGGRVNMCKAIDDMRREERQRGEQRGERNALLGNLRSLMENTGWGLSRAFDALNVSESERPSLAADLGVAL